MILKNKSDFVGLKMFKISATDSEIEEHSWELLSWLQDLNWPIAGQMADYLSNYLKLLTNDVVEILRGNDGVWKYSLMCCSLFPSDPIHLPVEIKDELNRIVNHPTEDDIAQEVVDVVKEYLYGIGGNASN